MFNFILVLFILPAAILALTLVLFAASRPSSTADT